MLLLSHLYCIRHYNIIWHFQLWHKWLVVYDIITLYDTFSYDTSGSLYTTLLHHMTLSVMTQVARCIRHYYIIQHFQLCHKWLVVYGIITLYNTFSYDTSGSLYTALLHYITRLVMTQVARCIRHYYII